jgi:hypothetical protein
MEPTSTTYNAATLAAALGSPPSQLLTCKNALVWKALVIPALRGARVLDLVRGIEKSPEEYIEVAGLFALAMVCRLVLRLYMEEECDVLTRERKRGDRVGIFVDAFLF